MKNKHLHFYIYTSNAGELYNIIIIICTTILYQMIYGIIFYFYKILKFTLSILFLIF